MSPLRRYHPRWRAIILFTVGVIGILAELVAHLWFDRKADPTLILVFAAMLGLTGFLGQREEEKKPG